MTQSTHEIHGHEVLDMMANSGRTFNRTSLIEAIEDKFGQDARFFICSGSGLSAKQLVDTLAAKSKFTGSSEAFFFNPANRCNH